MKSICISFLLFFSIIGFSQKNNDTITINTTGFLTKYIYQGKKLTRNEFNKIVPINDSAYYHVKKAYRYLIVSEISGAITGFCMGYPIGQTIKQGWGNWELLLVSAGTGVIMIPSMKLNKKHSKKAVYYYNQEIKKKELIPN